MASSICWFTQIGLYRGPIDIAAKFRSGCLTLQVEGSINECFVADSHYYTFELDEPALPSLLLGRAVRVSAPPAFAFKALVQNSRALRSSFRPIKRADKTNDGTSPRDGGVGEAFKKFFDTHVDLGSAVHADVVQAIEKAGIDKAGDCANHWVNPVTGFCGRCKQGA